MREKVKTFSEEEVKAATLEYFNQDDLATNVWMTKYALKEKTASLLKRRQMICIIVWLMSLLEWRRSLEERWLWREMRFTNY